MKKLLVASNGSAPFLTVSKAVVLLITPTRNSNPLPCEDINIITSFAKVFSCGEKWLSPLHNYIISLIIYSVNTIRHIFFI